MRRTLQVGEAERQAGWGTRDAGLDVHQAVAGLDVHQAVAGLDVHRAVAGLDVHPAVVLRRPAPPVGRPAGRR